MDPVTHEPSKALSFSLLSLYQTSSSCRLDLKLAFIHWWQQYWLILLDLYHEPNVSLLITRDVILILSLYLFAVCIFCFQIFARGSLHYRSWQCYRTQQVCSSMSMSLFSKSDICIHLQYLIQGSKLDPWPHLNICVFFYCLLSSLPDP